MDDADICIIDVLIKNGARVNSRDQNGNTPLFYAITRDNFNIVELLVKNGSNVDTKNKADNTPLFYAITIKNPDIIEFLVQKGANINAQDKQGKTYLHKTSDWQLAELLKSLGARSDIKDQNGKTACDYAAENGNYKLLDVLSPEQPLLHSEQADQAESDLLGVDEMFEKFGEPAGDF
jgi:ankyrin repeat protein